MRTTLAIDDDVLAAAKERAAREGKTVGTVLSELARASLTGGARAGRSTPACHGFEPFPPRGPVVTNTAIDEIRDSEAE